MLSRDGETQAQGNGTHDGKHTQPHKRSGGEAHIVHSAADYDEDMSDADTKNYAGCGSPEKIISFIGLWYFMIS